MYLTPKSGLFLGGACVTAIAAVGSVFELGSAHPNWGVPATIITLVLSIPLTGLFFIVAVRDARANIK